LGCSILDERVHPTYTGLSCNCETECHRADDIVATWQMIMLSVCGAQYCDKKYPSFYYVYILYNTHVDSDKILYCKIIPISISSAD